MEALSNNQRKDLLNKRVVIKNKFGGKYEGIVSGYRKNQICLTSLILYHGENSLGVTASKHNNVRWFNIEKIELQLVTK
jgi:hypothetical protein